MKIKIALTAILFLILSCITAFFSLKYTKSIAKDNLENEVVKVKQSFYESIKSAQVIASSYQILFSSLGDVDKESFQNYSENVMKEFQFVSSVAFHLEVQKNERQKFSKQFPQGIIDEVIKDGESKFVPSKISQFYYPLLFVDKANEEGAAFGWNASTDPLRAKAIELSLKENKPVASDSYLLPNGDAAFDIYFPVFNKKFKRGLVSLTLDIPLLLGDTKWFQNVDIILSLALGGMSNKIDVFKHNDQEPAGFFNVGKWDSEISIPNFGQENILKFEKIFYLNKLKYGILVLTSLACLLVTTLSCYLVHSYSVLEIKVKKRTKELKQTNEEIHEILNNLQDAVFIINSQFIIQNRYSPATEKLLNVTNPQGKNSKEILFEKLDKTNEDISRHLFAFEAVMNASEFQWDISNDDLLKTIPYYVNNSENGNLIQKTFSLKYTPFFENNELKKMLIVASDLSEIIQLRENFEQHQKSSSQKNIAINEVISADQKLMIDFFENAKKLIIEPLELMDKKQIDEIFLNLVFRNLHTLKGNSRSLKLTQLGKIIHEVENQFVLFKSSGIKDEYNKSMIDLKKIFSMYFEIVEQIFHARKNQDIPREIVENVVKWLAHENQDPKIIDEFLWNILEDKIFSFIDFLKSFLDMVEEISQSIEKKVNLVFDVPNVYFKKEIFIAIRNALTHILRNAIDHGIEPPQEREAKSKNQTGKIWFEVHKSQNLNTMKLTIYDDGQGVLLSKVYSIAKNKGITNKEFVELTEAEILEFLFLPGFSTKEDITELSGRGVGLDAVRAELKEVGISIAMDTEQGKGSSFVLEIPLVSVCFLEMGGTLLTC